MATAKKEKRVARVRGAEVTEKSPDELQGTLAEIEKRYGKVCSTGDALDQPERIPTGIFMLDFATLGGIPANRITKLVGHKHAGKSLLSDKIISYAQQKWPDQRVVKMDIEGTHESVWSSKLGVDNESLLVVQPETGEAALDMADAFIRTKEVSLIVVDSLAQLVPAKELEASAEDQFVGLQARLIGSFVRKAVSGLIAERIRGHEITLLFINQFRSKIGGYAPNGIEPLSEPGGKSLGFAYSLEITVKNKEVAGKDEFDIETMVENEHSFAITKNKMNAGPRTGEYRIRRVPEADYGLTAGDVDDASTMLAYAKKFGAYTGGGSSWKIDFWDEEHHVRSAHDAMVLLYENPDLKWKFRNFLICEQATHLGMPDSFLERFYPD